MRPNIFNFRKAITKTWPGGRRKATVIVSAGEDRTVPNWNRETAAFTRPYWPVKEEANSEPVQGE